MHVTFTCKYCGHEEHGEASRLLMTKIRMWNHLNDAHPGLVEPFSSSVEEAMQPTEAA